MGEERKGTLPGPRHFTKAGLEFHKVITQVGTQAPVGGRDGGGRISNLYNISK